MTEGGALHLELARLMDRQVAALGAWLESDAGERFGKSAKPVVPDPTFKLLPVGVVAVVVTHFLTRAYRNQIAITRLMGEHLAVEAQPVLRASLESAIDLRYIATNPQTLSTKWALYEDFWRFRNSVDVSHDSRPSDFGRLERQVATRLKQLDRHQPRKGHWRRQDLYRDWDLSSVKSRDDHAALVWGDSQHMYDFYRLLSDVQHGNSMSIRDFVVVNQDGYSTVHDLADRKRVYVQVIALHCMYLTIAAARLCGAPIDESGFDRSLSAMGLTREDLTAAAVSDFAISPAVAE